MAAFFALTLATMALAIGPGHGRATPPAQPLGAAESFSITAGRALGAAASCSEISGSRIDRDADRMAAAIERLAQDPAERRAAHRRLIESVGEGGGAVERGRLDCALARYALAEVERQLPK
jgi:hypothetical protein